MGAKKSIALKSVQWFVRGIQFCCAAIVLGIFSYFLATLSNRNLPINNWIRAVEGISGIAVIYTAAALALLCCLAGFAVTSFIAIVLDIAFIGAFIYVAWTVRGGAGSCNGIVATPFGTADADTNVQPNGNSGFTALPSFRRACQLQSATLAVSIVAIFFFLISAVMEVMLVRNRRTEKRYGPSPANDYTSGYGSAKKRRGFFGRRNRSVRTADTNVLPQHTHPDQVRDSYATESTAVGGGAAPQALHHKHGEPTVGNGVGHDYRHDPIQQPEMTQPAGYQGEANYPQRY